MRSAVVNSGHDWPMRRITVGLSPANLPKRVLQPRSGEQPASRCPGRGQVLIRVTAFPIHLGDLQATGGTSARGSVSCRLVCPECGGPRNSYQPDESSSARQTSPMSTIPTKPASPTTGRCRKCPVTMALAASWMLVVAVMTLGSEVITS